MGYVSSTQIIEYKAHRNKKAFNIITVHNDVP